MLKDELTPRQKELVDLVCLGLPNKEIAKRMGVKIDSVRKMLQLVFEKFEVESRHKLIFKCAIIKLKESVK